LGNADRHSDRGRAGDARVSFIGVGDRIESDYGNAYLLAVAGAAAFTALGVVLVAIGSEGLSTDLAALPMIFLFAFLVAVVIIGLSALLIGLPLTWLLARHRLERPWTYPFAGLAAGAGLVTLAPSLLSGDLRIKAFLEFLPYAPVGALPGCLCGAIWWRIYRRHMQDLGDERG
jgi:hypothetical protein